MKYGEYIIAIKSFRPHDTDPMEFLSIGFAHKPNKAPVICYGGQECKGEILFYFPQQQYNFLVFLLNLWFK